jgi:hypothetical protein
VANRSRPRRPEVLLDTDEDGVLTTVVCDGTGAAMRATEPVISGDGETTRAGSGGTTGIPTLSDTKCEGVAVGVGKTVVRGGVDEENWKKYQNDACTAYSRIEIGRLKNMMRTLKRNNKGANSNHGGHTFLWAMASSESLTRCPVKIGSRASLRVLVVNGADEFVLLAAWGKLDMVVRGACALRSRSRVLRVPLTTEGSVEIDTDVTVNRGEADPCPEAWREAPGRDSAGTTSRLLKATLLRAGDDFARCDVFSASLTHQTHPYIVNTSSRKYMPAIWHDVGSG